jgi:hypothetical protein
MPAKVSVGDLLGTSARVFFRNAHTFLVFTAIGHLPLILWAAALARRDGITDRALSHYESGGFYLRLALDAFGASAIAFGVNASLRGERARLGACLAAGVRRFLPSLLVLVVTAIATILGAFLLVIPGLIVLCAMYVAVPVSVIERPGPFASLERSRALTLGHRFKILGAVLVVWIAMFVLLVVAIAIVGVHGREDYWARSSYIWCVVIVQLVFGTVGAVVSAVTYVRLRGAEEGGDASLGKVFE